MQYLKDYQEDCVHAVTAYMRRARELGNARLAFLEDPSRGEYLTVNGLEGLPYVCMKVPTGGGKTAIAAFCVKPLLEVMGQREAGPVIWLAPTTKIVEQTVAALRDRSHAYRRELDRAFDGRVTVCDMEAALSLTQSTMRTDCVILVTTFGSVRRQDPQLLKAFRVNGALKHHFDGLTEDQRQALFACAGDDDDPTQPTLANVLRMHRPVVVVDEAHNARTALSFDTLKRFGPSCVLELTATPADDSNVLLAVSAARLKAEQMIKLPVMLRARAHARDAIGSAVEKRKQLADLAAAERSERGYVRPIVLYQAESADGEFNPQGVKRLLCEDMGIDPSKVAICTGSIDELPDEPIDSEKNPIEHVITVQKLREGWDCPFAYVLCSVSNLGSRVAVEQILGRVLRMPYARQRGAAELNRAYCYATSDSFQAAANDLEAALVENCGFSKHEARRIVRREPESGGPTLFDDQPPPVSIDVGGSVDMDRLPATVREHVAVTTLGRGGSTVTWTGGLMEESSAAALTEALTDAGDARAIERLRRRSWSEDDSPAALGVPFAVPALAMKEGDEWVLLDDQPFEGEWSLADCAHELTESEFKVATGDPRVARFDVDDAGSVMTRFLDDLDRQVFLFEKSGRDTPAKLARWLDRAIRDPFILPHDKQTFLLRMVEALIDKRGLDIGQLDRHRHQLKDAAAAKIAAHRLYAEKTAYQQLLSGDFGVDMSCRIAFPAAYPADKLCDARVEWQKHYYSDVAAMNGDELEVAKYLDSRGPVLHWVRNLDGEHHVNHAFWLRRPHGRFFPDFVAELVGEKFLVVEFKGPHIEQNESEQEKRRVGELWEAQATDEFAFVWATKQDWRDKIDTAIARLCSG
jgi:type III restriction enzyme